MTQSIEKNISLRTYNTFGIEVQATALAVFKSKAELESLLNSSEAEKGTFILGGGSNILFTQSPRGLVLKCEIPGIKVTEQTDEHVFLKVGAGVDWDSLVNFCVERNYGGIENLIKIPGTCGAAPIQNIGAYGVELKDCLVELEAYHLDDKKTRKFSCDECEFSYRESVFKKRYKNEYAILDITLQLEKRPKLKTEYGAIKTELERMKTLQVRVADVARAVKNIRTEKLPDPKVLGNAGSFFKNPSVSQEKFEELKKTFPDIVAFPLPDKSYKLAAGWLLEQCGWKGQREGEVGCYEKQALILVNHGKATGQEVFNFSEKIIESVQGKFGVELQREVNVV